MSYSLVYLTKSPIHGNLFLSLSHICFFLKLINLFILLYNIVLVSPYIDLNLPWVYMCSPSWTPLPTPSPSHPSGHQPWVNRDSNICIEIVKGRQSILPREIIFLWQMYNSKKESDKRRQTRNAIEQITVCVEFDTLVRLPLILS